MKTTCVLLFAAATLLQAIHCDELLIGTPEEFADFIKSVNSGNSYHDDTVLLKNSLDFSTYSGEILPVGSTMDSFFSGTFNGQGNTISNYHMNVTTRYTGLFGYTRGATFKNFMLDETCSITTSHESTANTYIAGVVGKCFTLDKACVIDNAVNKATITFSGNVEGDVTLGGIIGNCEYSDFYCSIKNNANFATITDNGSTTWFSQIGGIVGLCEGTEEKRCKVHNCLNYGNLHHVGTAKDVIMGGIVGNVRSVTNVQNCVSLGKVLNGNPGKYNPLGGIVGYVLNEGSSVERNYWCSEGDTDAIVGYNYSYVEVNDNAVTSPNADMINTLNSYARANNWDMWALNLNHATFSLELNGFVIFVSTLEVIHLPNLALYEGYTFSGFYMDHELLTPMTNFILESDLTVHSTWTPIDYELTFVYNESYNETKMVTFATAVSLPELEQKEGYTAMWCTNDSITCDPSRMPPYSLTLHPTWVLLRTSSSSSSTSGNFSGTASRYVLVVFKMESMWTSEVEDIISIYGGESKHTVYSIEDKDLTTEVTIIFEKIEDAVEFVENIRASKTQAAANKIASVTYLDESQFSFSIPVVPLLSLYGLFI